MNADQFNARYPVGTPVVAYPGIRPEHPVAVAYRKRAEDGRAFGTTDPCTRLDAVTRTPAWTLGHGQPVVSVEGYAGGIALDHVDVTDEPTHQEHCDPRTSGCCSCAPLVELEAQGCRTWQLTPRNITAVDDEVDRDGIYAKGFFEQVGNKTVCVGLRIGTGETRIVARFGDHVIRHRDGRWTVRHAPADTGTEGQA